MTYDEFTRGYKDADPEVTDEKVKESFSNGDTDGSGTLSYDEFQALFNSLSGQVGYGEEGYWEQEFSKADQN